MIVFEGPHQQDAGLVRVDMIEKATKVEQILVMEEMKRKIQQALEEEDFAHDSSDQMMMKMLDPQIASQCMRMMREKHTNPNVSR
jgi:hypothetical protein